MAFVIVSIGVIVLRRTRPDLPRPFRMPMVPLLPALSALVALVLMLGLPRATWERLIIWMVDRGWSSTWCMATGGAELECGNRGIW